VKKVTRIITYNAVIGAMYVALTYAVLELSYGNVQFRFSEALTVLPVFFPSAYIGLAVGCAVGNLLSSYGVADIVLGSLTTLVAGFLTSKIKKVPWALLPPIVLNALVVPYIIILAGAEPATYWLNVLTVGGGQTVVIFGLGLPLYYLIKSRLHMFKFETTEKISDEQEE